MNESYPVPYPDVPASQIFRAKDVRKSGMLRKKAGGFKLPVFQDLYDHRFVIIHKGWVYYYKNEKSEKQQGNFSLEGYSSNVVNAEEEEAKMQHVFKVYGKSATTRIWYFAAENEMEKREWMDAFRLEIEQYKFAASNIKFSSSSPCPRSGEAHTSVNERPKSINITDGAFNQMHKDRSALMNCPSSATLDTGFSSMKSSFGPEDDYEPVNGMDDSDEFDTDSNEDDYESPFMQPQDVVDQHATNFVFAYRDLPGTAPLVPIRDPISKPPEVFRKADSMAVVAELEQNGKAYRHWSSSSQRHFEKPSMNTSSRAFIADKRVSENSLDDAKLPPPSPLKPSPSHYLPMSARPSDRSASSIRQPRTAHKDLRSPGPKIALKPTTTSPHLSFGQKWHSSKSTVPSFPKHQHIDETVRGPSTSEGASTVSWPIGTKPTQRPFSDAFVSGRKFGIKPVTSEQGHRHSADVSHMSYAWEHGREINSTRPPEPLPHSTTNFSHGISGHQLDDVPRRPPPNPPPEKHQGVSSNRQNVTSLSPQRVKPSDFQHSNLPQYPASPMLGFGIHKYNFDFSYATNSDMLQFRLPPTTSSQGNGNHKEQSPVYCDMDDETPDHQVNQPRRPFSRHPVMPPVEEYPAQDTVNSTQSQHQGQFQSSRSEHLPASSTQRHGRPDALLSNGQPGPNNSENANTIGLFSKPSPPQKPVPPRKPDQLLPRNKGKPLLPVKPRNLNGSNQVAGGVGAIRAAFESNQR